MRMNLCGWAGLAGSAVCALVLGCGGGGSGSTGGTGGSGGPTITGVTLTPTTATVTIGTTQQFTAAVQGTGAYNSAVTWLVTGPSGWTGSVGSISTAGLYESPFPAPASVTVTAYATGDESKSAAATVTLQPPAATAGPALTVDAGNETHAISPLIYGMNGFLLDPTTAANANITVTRWGGDATSRYNYQTNVTNSASDYYFENFTGEGQALSAAGSSVNFTQFVTANSTLGIRALGTVPVQGWVSNGTAGACSFPESTYPGQVSYNGNCGDGEYPQGTQGCTAEGGCAILGSTSTPAITSVAEPPPAPPAASGATLSLGAGNLDRRLGELGGDGVRAGESDDRNRQGGFDLGSR